MSARRSQKKLRLQKWTIDSRDRDEGVSHDFKFRFPHGMRLATGGWARVTAVTLPMSYFTIRTGYNSEIAVTGPGWAGNFDIVAGFYATPGELATAVDTGCKTLDAGFECTYDEIRMQFRFYHPTNTYQLAWVSASTDPNFTAAAALGFDPDTDTPVLSDRITTSERHPTFGDPTGFDIRSTALTRGTFSAIKTKLLGDRSLVRVPNAGERAGLLHWASLEDSGRALAQLKAPDGGVQLDEVDISVWTAGDDNGPQLLDLRDAEFIIELEIAGLE